MPETHAEIHHFDYDPASGDVSYDEDGDPLNGWYFEIIGENGMAMFRLFGPYANKDEVEVAAQLEWRRCK